MISIADRGPGIEDFEQSLIFEKFTAAATSACRCRARAWDWPSAKAIVEAHGGEIGVTSHPATVCFLLHPAGRVRARS